METYKFVMVAPNKMDQSLEMDVQPFLQGLAPLWLKITTLESKR